MTTILTAQARVRLEGFNLNDEELNLATELLIEKARKGKTSIVKLSEKAVIAIVDVATSQHDDAPQDEEPRTLTVVPTYNEVIREVVHAKRGSHADCDHAATKVARAKCRRQASK